MPMTVIASAPPPKICWAASTHWSTALASPLSPLVDAHANLWLDVLSTNLVGASLVCCSVLGHLREGGGRAVLLGSSSVGRPFPGLVPYAASKAALEELIRGWRAGNPDVLFTSLVGPTAETFHGAVGQPSRGRAAFVLA
jgi:NAD(P)-dependent dehydrogenase (short-subunit alcohol dehydrogenase family)